MVRVSEKERTRPDEVISTQEHKTLRVNGDMSKVDTFWVSKPKTEGWNRLRTRRWDDWHWSGRILVPGRRRVAATRRGWWWTAEARDGTWVTCCSCELWGWVALLEVHQTLLSLEKMVTDGGGVAVDGGANSGPKNLALMPSWSLKLSEENHFSPSLLYYIQTTHIYTPKRRETAWQDKTYCCLLQQDKQEN